MKDGAINEYMQVDSLCLIDYCYKKVEKQKKHVQHDILLHIFLVIN